MGWIILLAVLYLFALAMKVIALSLLLCIIILLYFLVRKLAKRKETDLEYRFMRTYLNVYRKILMILLVLAVFGTFAIVLPLNLTEESPGGTAFSFWGAFTATISIGIAWVRTARLSKQPASKPGDNRIGNYAVWIKHLLICALLFALALYAPLAKVYLMQLMHYGN
jgi:hypothetical protein